MAISLERRLDSTQIAAIQIGAKFVADEQERLFDQYPGECIAVRSKKVVAHQLPVGSGWVDKFTMQLDKLGLKPTEVYTKVLVAKEDEFTAYGDISKLPDR